MPKKLTSQSISLIKWAVISVLILALIWIIGPYVELQNRPLFPTLPSKLIPSLIIFLIWAVYLIYLKIRTKKHRASIAADSADRESTINLNHLEKLFYITQKYLKKHKNETGVRSKLRPWIFVIGPEGCGKTTLFQQCQFPLKSPIEHIDPVTNTASNYLNWWIDKDAIFIEINANHESLIKNQQPTFLWKKIFELCEQSYQSFPIDHLVITLDAALFLNSENELNNFTASLLQQLSYLKKQYQSFNISIAINKCDMLDGFVAFFEDLTPKERLNYLGFELATAKTQLDPAKSLDHSLATLIQRVSNHLIWRLHHEQSQAKRNRIKDFPFVFELLCQQLNTWLQQIPFDDKMNLQGVYFNSSIQPKNNDHLLAQIISKTFNVTPSFNDVFLAKQKSFFQKAFLENVISQAAKPNKPYLHKISRLIAIPVAAAIILGNTYLWHYEYHQTVTTFNAVQQSLSKAADKKTTDLPWLAEISIIDNALAKINQINSFGYAMTGLPQAYLLKQRLQDQYQKILISKFQPFLLETLLKQIKSGLQSNKLSLYNAFKTYMMLITPKHYDAAAIQQWFFLNWRKEYPNKQSLQMQLQQQLNNLMQMSGLNWPKDQKLIKIAQDGLKQLSLAQLAFLELEEKYKPDNVAILSKSSQASGIDVSNAKIPSFYSSENFKQVYNTEIPNIDKTLQKGNWVLGTTTGITLKKKQMTQLISDVRKIYLKHYTQQWQNLIPSIQLKTPNNLNEAEQAISLLTKQQSELIQLLKIVIGNATLLTKAGDPTLTTNKNFIAAKDFVNKKGRYAVIQKSLNQLNTILDTIRQSKDPNAASFLMTSQRFKKTSKQDPIIKLLTLSKQTTAPLSGWLKTIATGSWQVLLKNSLAFINVQWASSVIPEYNKNIKNRYPVFSDASSEISLNNFKQFFGPSGVIQQFFQNYIQPFANISQNYWTWETVNGKTIGISQANLDMLLRASLIQQMFFTTSKNKIGFKFSLVPTALSDNLKTFDIDLEGQKMHITPGAQLIKNFNWPGQKPSEATYTFTDKNKTTKTQTFTGQWAVFKLFDSANLNPTDNSQKYQLSIQSGNSQAQFLVLADNVINPFLPGILTGFRCPERL